MPKMCSGKHFHVLLWSSEIESLNAAVDLPASIYAVCWLIWLFYLFYFSFTLKLPIKMPCPCHGTTVAHIIHRKHGWVYLMRCNEVHSKSSGHCDGCIINALKKTNLPEPLSFSITSGLNSWLSIQFLYSMFWKRKSKQCTVLLFRFSFSHQLNEEIICLISVADSAVWSTRFQIYCLSKVRQDSTAMVAK